MEAVRTLFVDTETTGIVRRERPVSAQEQPRIVQIGMALHDSERREVSAVSLVVNPGVVIPDGAARVHGITTDVAQAVGVPPTAIVGLFIRLNRVADVVVAYNADFDMLALECEFYRAKTSWTAPKEVRCPMTAATEVVKLPPTARMVECGFGDKFKPPKLEEAYEHFAGQKMAGAHDALSDARACASVYYALLNMGRWEKAA